MINPEKFPGHYNENDSDENDANAPILTIVPSECAGMRFDQALQHMFPDYSRSRLQAWIKDGLATLEGRQVESKTKVWGDERVSLTPQLTIETSNYLPEDIPLNVIYEDDTLLVVNKAAGLVVHPGNGNWEGTMLNALLAHSPQLAQVPRAGIVHRLDKETSGLLVVGKTIPAQTDLVRQLQARTVKREYIALAQGIVETDGTVDVPIGRHPRERTKMAVVENGKPAVTHYRVLETFRAHTLVECRLETGRTHQIRVHMHYIGHPMAADPVYGGRPRVLSPAMFQAVQSFGRQALHAARLALVHPATGKEMRWKAPLPDDMLELIDFMRRDVHGKDIYESGDGQDDEDLDDDDDDYDVEVVYQP